MTVPNTSIFYGSYVSDGKPRVISIVADVDYFKLFNVTKQSSSGSAQYVKKAEWIRGLDAANALVVRNSISAATDESSLLTSGGFTLFDYANLPIYPLIAITSITAANPPVVTTSADHNLSPGDFVEFSSLTEMPQISGSVWKVTIVDSTRFTIDVNGSAFDANTANGSMRRIAVDAPKGFLPKRRYITRISQATNAVVTTSADHLYSLNEVVSFVLPPQFGMTQINGLQGKIIAVTATTFTVDIDTTAFNAFAYPLAGEYPFTQAQAIPVGIQGSNLLTDATHEIGIRGLELGTAIVGDNNDVMRYIALKGVSLS